MNRPPGLPDFAQPPLAEVVLGVQFEPLEGFRSLSYGPVHTLFASEYPRWEEKPPLPPSFEVPNASGASSINIETNSFLLPRLWLKTSDGSSLIQVQPDRFIMNWRRDEGDGIYPRYEAIRQKFAASLKAFSDFAEANGLGAFKPNQAEVTYINHLEAPGPSNNWARASDFVRTVGEDSWADPEASVEEVFYQIRHSLTDGSGEWRGRMHVALHPTITRENRKALSLNLSVRGEPRDRDLGGVLVFMDWARMKIVNHFTALTTEEMHLIWKRTQ